MNLLEIANAIYECRRRGMIPLRLYRDGRAAGVAIAIDHGFRKCWTMAEFEQAMIELPDEPHDFIKSMVKGGAA